MTDEFDSEEEENDYDVGDNPCGFCEGNMHFQCDSDDCTCACRKVK